MLLEIEVSELNESTAEAWWTIIDPSQMMRPDVYAVANMITGPFFSREEAQQELTSRRYNYGKHAVVYCHSGCNSSRYKEAHRKAEDRR